MPTTFGTHPAHQAHDWTDADPNAREPFTGQHFAYWTAVPAILHIMQAFNTFRHNTYHIKPKPGCKAYNILPALPVASRDNLIGKVVLLYLLSYSPEELHTNVIDNRHPATAVNEETGRIVSGTWRLVSEFMGLCAWAFFVKFDVHPTTFPYRTSPTEVFAKEDWEEMEKHYHKFLLDVMKHPNVRVFLGSKSTINLVEEVFGDELPKYLVRFFTTADGKLVTVVHPEMLKNKKIRGLAFASHCREYDAVFTQLRREVEGPDAEECTIGSQMLGGESFDWLVCSGEDIIEYLIANYDSNMLVSHLNVPEMVQGYATKNTRRITRYHEIRLPFPFMFAELTLSQLHQFMSSMGGRRWAEMHKEARLFLNDAMGRGESWGDACTLLQERGLWNDAYRWSIKRFMKHVKTIKMEIRKGENVVEVAASNPRRTDLRPPTKFRPSANQRYVVVPKDTAARGYLSDLAKDYDESDWRWLFLSHLEMFDPIHGSEEDELEYFLFDMGQFVAGRDKLAAKKEKEIADTFRNNRTESVRRDLQRVAEGGVNGDAAGVPDADTLAAINRSRGGG